MRIAAKLSRILETDSKNSIALVARLSVAFMVLPHGAQKLLGWFGGLGFRGTMNQLIGVGKIPYIIEVLVIAIQFFGGLFLFLGLATRFVASATIVLFIGIVGISDLNFFMNWSSQAGQVEGFEFFILLFGLALISLILGGGRASVDAAFRNQT